MFNETTTATAEQSSVTSVRAAALTGQSVTASLLQRHWRVVLGVGGSFPRAALPPARSAAAAALRGLRGKGEGGA